MAKNYFNDLLLYINDKELNDYETDSDNSDTTHIEYVEKGANQVVISDSESEEEEPKPKSKKTTVKKQTNKSQIVLSDSEDEN